MKLKNGKMGRKHKTSTEILKVIKKKSENFKELKEVKNGTE